MTAIKYIVFDLSEVLLTGIRETGLALAEKHKLEDLVEHDLGYTKEPTPLLIPLVSEFFHGNVSEDEYIKAVLSTYPQLGTQEDLKQHIRDNFTEVVGTRAIVIELRRLGYKLGLLSVHAKEWIDFCEQKFDFHNLFDARVYSYETKVSKPDPLAFQAVLDQLQAKAQECLFIDDAPMNIESARRLGFHTILFTTAADLGARLRDILPNFAPVRQ